MDYRISKEMREMILGLLHFFSTDADLKAPLVRAIEVANSCNKVREALNKPTPDQLGQGGRSASIAEKQLPQAQEKAEA